MVALAWEVLGCLVQAGCIAAAAAAAAAAAVGSVLSARSAAPFRLAAYQRLPNPCLRANSKREFGVGELVGERVCVRASE